MTNRDRLVLIGITTLALLAAVWLLVVSPVRQRAAKLGSEVSTASTQLAAAESQVANARSAEADYPTAYASIVRLGKAVPADDEVPALVYQLAQATNQKDVEFSSIVSGGGAATSPSSTSTPATAATVGFKQMPFTFTFTGTFADLYKLFQQLNRYTVRTASGGIQVSGRLLTIQSAKLAPVTSQAANGKSTGARKLTGTVTATAYVLPAAQGLTAGATASSPTGAATSAAATPAAAPAAATTTPAPAAIVGAAR